jgi:hypothetical protein
VKLIPYLGSLHHEHKDGGATVVAEGGVSALRKEQLHGGKVILQGGVEDERKIGLKTIRGVLTICLKTIRGVIH